MTAGMHPTNLVSKMLNWFRGSGAAAPTAVTTTFIQLHTGDPGAAGNTAVSVGSTTRNAANWNASAAGTALALNAVPAVWTNAATTETISYISIWDASTAGNCLWTVALTTPQPWVATNTFTLNTCTFALTPQMA